MDVIVYNTLTRKKERLEPINQGHIGIYGCGVTPYKPSHLGHAMQAVIFDVIRRYLQHKGLSVTYVRNYTDIDDKIIKAAKEVNKNPLEYSKEIINIRNEDLVRLRVGKADFEPKVSDVIPEIIEMIQDLISKGFAYPTTQGNVYFEVSKFKEYGKLSNQDITHLMAGSRSEVEKDKKDPKDFALWKSANEGEVQFWEAPWGKGRPGWHIECSVMSTKYLGEHFDIHGGGGDLLFPHHENEIAQSEAAHEGKFAKHWLHNGLLMVGNEKMGKSLNNDVSIGNWLEKYHPEVLRYMILSNHYRSHVQFVPQRYEDTNKKVFEIYKSIQRAQIFAGEVETDRELASSINEEFESYMDNDFNTVQVVAMINRISSRFENLIKSGTEKDRIKTKSYLFGLESISNVINLFNLNPMSVIEDMRNLEIAKSATSKAEIENAVEERDVLRKQGKFEEADKIRNSLNARDILISDLDGHSWWEPKF